MENASRRKFLASGLATAGGAWATTMLAACSGSSAPSSSGSSGGGSSATGGTLQAAISAEPSDFDPDHFTGGVGLYFYANVFERLYQQDQAGNVVPWLAKDYTISADGRTYTFDLRPDVTFHDGTKMTADDVVFSFQRFAAPSNPNAFELPGFVKAVAVTPTQVQIQLSKYDAAFIANGGYTYIFPKAYLTKVGNAGFASKPIGTGPFRFGGQQVNSYFQLDRYTGYWGPKAGYDSIKVNIVPTDSTRVAQLQSGQVNLISQVPPQSVSTLKASSNATVKTVVDGDGIWIGVNCKSPAGSPWLNSKVRQAMAHAIDNAAILKSVAFGLGQLSAGLLPSEPGFAQSGLRQLPYDPATAKALLAEAGYPHGFSIPFSAPVNGRVPYSEEIAQAVTGYWAAVGIKASTTIQSYDAWIKATQAGSTFGAYFVVFGANSNDCQFRLSLSLQTGAPVSNVADPRMDALINAVATERDVATRQQDIVAAWKYAIETQAYQLPIFEASEAFAFTTNKVSWSPWVGQAATILPNAHPL
jgi:peptide/nickel transport system substrate-binding protein